MAVVARAGCVPYAAIMRVAKSAGLVARDVPCPFLGALESAKHIGEHVPLRPLADLVVAAFGARGARAAGLEGALAIIGAIANGVRSIPRNVRAGFRPHELRQGPLDKRGGGTRILSQGGAFEAAEMERFEGFGRPYPSGEGNGIELGWGRRELQTYLDANQERGGGGFVQRRVLMQGELPQLLDLMGRGEGQERHLVASEVKALYRDQVLPERIEQRIAGMHIADPLAR